MLEEGENELEIKPAKAGARKTAVKSKRDDDEDDDDDVEEADDRDPNFEEEDGLDLDNDDAAYKADKDFEEFDMPKSKAKSGGTGAKKAGGDDMDDDFRDLGLDFGGGGRGGYDDEDDDF